VKRIALLAVVLVAAGCGSSHDDFRQTPAVVAHPKIDGGPFERRTLEEILARMAPTHIRALRVTRNTLTVYAGESVRAQWEGALLAAMFNVRQPIKRLVSGDGISGPGVLPNQPRFDLARIRAVARRSGATILELRREGLGLAVVVQTDDPARFLERDGLAWFDSFGRDPLKALYAGIADRHGAIVYAFGRLPSEGIFYTRPELDSCGPIQHSEPVTAKPPPGCPA
jgi:hypothetical protein